MERMDGYAKAIVSAAGAGLATLYTALLDGKMSAPEYVLVASAVVGNLLLTWAVPNEPMPVVKADNG